VAVLPVNCSTQYVQSMGYRVELTGRAERDLRLLYQRIRADDATQAFAWFNRLAEVIFSLEEHRSRGTITRESKKLRHLHYGKKPHVYRVIYGVNERAKRVVVLHIRHGARDAFTAEETG
jgi:toxin ParE1/3/4